MQAIVFEFDIRISAHGDPDAQGHMLMPPDIKDEETARLLTELLARKRAAEAVPLRERFALLREAHPLPCATGQVADKEFFDDLSGEP